MGRHRKPTNPPLRRGSVITLTGLIPAGIVAANATATVPTESAATPVDPVAAKRPADEYTANVMAKPFKAPHTVVKTVARPANRPKAELPNGPLDIPGIANAAYTSAEEILARENPTCGISRGLLSGIGKVESGHMHGGQADPEGNALEPIYGPVLDGTLARNNVVADTDNGALDNTTGYDRAVGPMQFLPATWEKYGADGNGDGIADPQNYYDATLTAGKYLCSTGLNLRDPAQQARAILRYNNSMAYVANVMAWATAYQTSIAPRPTSLPQI